MKKEQWKKVFQSIPDERLAELCEVWDVKVKGFRTLNKQTMKRARKRVVTQLVDFNTLRPIVAFYELANAWGEENKEERMVNVDVRSATVSELIQAYEDGEELHFLLGGLYTSEDESHHALADEFIDALLTHQKVQSIEQLRVTPLEETDMMNQEEVDDQEAKKADKQTEKKIEKIEAKNQKLQQQINEWEQQYSKLKQEFKEEKQQWIKERAQLHQEMSYEKKQFERVQQVNDGFEQEKQVLKDEITELKANIAHLHTQILKAKKQVAVTVEDEKQEESKDFTILLIGDPKNKIIEESTNPVFKVVDPRNHDVMEELDVSTFDELWMLTYLVPMQMRKKWTVPYKEKLKSFANFNEVKSYMTKGRK
ncbi:hypothetical protein [Bacillus sp. CGMCC 1.16541]|uniref:hypothetical protein n=1 Tax=Bacillus sp. CGMCC 1.16541 TaxID=2185143 RepID=UPI0013A5A843|nr:hypothetical protein [Bacillus sp. CGMCC 1.16541]